MSGLRGTVLLVALLLAGCGHYEWVRIAPGPGNFNQENYVCQRDAAGMAPPVIVQEVERTKRETRVSSHDANTGNRDNIYKSCMAAYGWRQVFVEDGKPRPQPTVMMSPPPQPAPPPMMQQPMAPPPGAPAAAAPGSPVRYAGTWKLDDDDTLTLSVSPDGTVQGQYGDGTVSGRIAGVVFDGTWRESSGDRACRRTQDGTYWGRLRFTFAPDQRHFQGVWGYCDDNPVKPWNGRR